MSKRFAKGRFDANKAREGFDEESFETNDRPRRRPSRPPRRDPVEKEGFTTPGGYLIDDELNVYKVDQGRYILISRYDRAFLDPSYDYDEYGGYYDKYGGYSDSDLGYYTPDDYYVDREGNIFEYTSDGDFIAVEETVDYHGQENLVKYREQDSYNDYNDYYADEYNSLQSSKNSKSNIIRNIIIGIIVLALAVGGFLFASNSGLLGSKEANIVTSNDFQKLLLDELILEIDGVTVSSLEGDYLYEDIDFLESDAEKLKEADYLVIQNKELDKDLLKQIKEASEDLGFKVNFSLIELFEEKEPLYLKSVDNSIESLEVKINKVLSGNQDANDDGLVELDPDKIDNSLFKDLEMDKLTSSHVDSYIGPKDGFEKLIDYVMERNKDTGEREFKFENPINKSIFYISLEGLSTKEIKLNKVVLEDGYEINKPNDHRFPNPNKGDYIPVEKEENKEEDKSEEDKNEEDTASIDPSLTASLDFMLYEDSKGRIDTESTKEVVEGSFYRYGSEDSIKRMIESYVTFLEGILSEDGIKKLEKNVLAIETSLSEVRKSREKSFANIKKPIIIYVGSGDIRGYIDWFQIKPAVASVIDDRDVLGKHNVITLLDYVINFPDSYIVVDKGVSNELIDEIKYISPQATIIEMNHNMQGSSYKFIPSLEALLDSLADGVEAY